MYRKGPHHVYLDASFYKGPEGFAHNSWFSRRKALSSPVDQPGSRQTPGSSEVLALLSSAAPLPLKSLSAVPIFRLPWALSF